MRKVSVVAVICLSAAASALAQSRAPVSYHASFENAVHHEARITATFRDIGERPLTLRMSRSSPGRYAIHEFAKNVYQVAAVDGAGRELAVTHSDPYSWRVEGHDGTVVVAYTLYADHADGTYSQIDLTHAHLNAPATFLWAEGFSERPIEIAFQPASPAWKAATQLPPAPGKLRFTAPNLQYLMDSPIELSDFELREWTIGEGATRQAIRLAVHHQGETQDVDAYAEKAKKVIDQAVALFGEAPRFDYGVYTFIADYLPYVDGDGMEHRNSTILTSTRSLYDAEFAQLGTLSHEFFHAWNVERLRPEKLEPFDFTQANPTPSLWFAEGFTSYYGPLLVRRAGESSVEDFLGDIGRPLDLVLNAPGRRFASPRDMSLRAAFVDAATSIDPTNDANTFISYYPYGAVVALALDLTIRQRFDGLTLDDLMRRLWETHGRVEKPYTPDDLRRALGAVTGDPAFADEFFARYIDKGDLPDFAPLLSQAGLTLARKNPGAASLGKVDLDEDGKALHLASNTLIGAPLYEAGLDRGDEILRIGRFDIDGKNDWDRALKRHKPGETVTIAYRQRGVEKKASITFYEDATLEIVPVKDGELTSEQESFRSDWLGPEK